MAAMTRPLRSALRATRPRWLLVAVAGLAVGALLLRLSVGEVEDAGRGGAAPIAAADGALREFAFTHGRLPCPDVDADGRENVVARRCERHAGELPYRDLGMAAAPGTALGRSLRYWVSGPLAAQARGRDEPADDGGAGAGAPDGFGNDSVAALGRAWLGERGRMDLCARLRSGERGEAGSRRAERPRLAYVIDGPDLPGAGIETVVLAVRYASLRQDLSCTGLAEEAARTRLHLDAALSRHGGAAGVGPAVASGLSGRLGDSSPPMFNEGSLQ